MKNQIEIYYINKVKSSYVTEYRTNEADVTLTISINDLITYIIDNELNMVDVYNNEFKEWYYHGKYIDCKNNQEFLRIAKLIVFL